ncbi:T-cell surface antigen CD2 [Eleutherodactylus coqui]|uniref:T-cell surface antigen CD2 n=1 Tax=Eleutherodactylus coqui TaxID=57060 RepID=UPI0034630F98
MEVQGSMRLHFWTLLCLLLSGMVETKTIENYILQNHTALLKVPGCQVEDLDDLQWEEGKLRLARWNKKKESTPSYYSGCKDITLPCTLHQNGSLFLRRPNEKTNYTLKVYKEDGNPRCEETVVVIVEDVLEQPVIHHNCTRKGIKIRCSTNARSISNLTLSCSSKSETTSEKSATITINEHKVDVSCVIKNRLSQSTATRTVVCGVWDIYLIASVAGGAVALIIFIALVFYTVKYKPWRSHSRNEEDVEISRLQSNTLQRQLPQPPDQTDPGYLSGSSQGDFTVLACVEKATIPHRQEAQEMAPEGKKGKKPNRSQRQPPQDPGENAKMYVQVSPRHPTPALPGNHPSEQAPKPQPRTKSKPQRRNYKN